jgi:hypothetical protein
MKLDPAKITNGHRNRSNVIKRPYNSNDRIPLTGSDFARPRKFLERGLDNLVVKNVVAQIVNATSYLDTTEQTSVNRVSQKHAPARTHKVLIILDVLPIKATTLKLTDSFNQNFSKQVG